MTDIIGKINNFLAGVAKDQREIGKKPEPPTEKDLAAMNRAGRTANEWIPSLSPPPGSEGKEK
jgi:hypothetical protein